jgi:hypothetical protein
MVLGAIRYPGPRSVRNFDGHVRQASKLARSQKQQDEDRQHKSKLYEGLPAITANGPAPHNHSYRPLTVIMEICCGHVLHGSLH